MSPRQFTIRSLLIVTALVAADFAWIGVWRPVPPTAISIFLTHLAAVIATWILYRSLRRVVENSLPWQCVMAFGSTLLAAAWCGMLMLMAFGMENFDGSPRAIAPGEVVESSLILVALGTVIALLPTAIGVAVGLMTDWAFPRRFRARAHCLVAGLIAANLCASMMLRGSGGQITWLTLVPALCATVICWTFGTLVDLAQIPRSDAS